METVRPIQSGRNESPFHENAPDKVISDVTVENFVERPRADCCVEKHEENPVENPVSACKNEILLNEVSQVL